MRWEVADGEIPRRWLSGDVWRLFTLDTEVTGDADDGGGIIELSTRLKLSILVYIVLLLPRRS